MSETLKVTVELKERQTVGGITLFEDNTGRSYFAEETNKKEIISCPDEVQAFDGLEAIDIHPTYVSCRLTKLYPKDLSYYRIYLRDTKTWLRNPAAGIDKKREFDFFEPERVAHQFIFVSCPGDKEGNRLFLTETSSWIAIPYWFSDETQQTIVSFKEFILTKFQGRDSILLTGFNDRNPYSVFFLDTKEHFSVPPPPTKAINSTHQCVVFCKVFPKYVAIRYGSGGSVLGEYCYVYRLKEQDYFAHKKPVVSDDDLKFSFDNLGEHFVLLGSRLQGNDYQIFSTFDWNQIEVVSVSYDVLVSNLRKVSFNRDGSLQVYVLPANAIEVTIPIRRTTDEEK